MTQQDSRSYRIILLSPAQDTPWYKYNDLMVASPMGRHRDAPKIVGIERKSATDVLFIALKHFKFSHTTQRPSCSTIPVFIAHANSASSPGSGNEHIKHALTTPAYILSTAASSLLSADSMNKLRMGV